MFDSILSYFESKKIPIALAAGILYNFTFAPYFIWPLCISLAILLHLLLLAKDKDEATKIGATFTFGFYLANLYWISIGVSVYITDFWWALPFSFFGLPAFLSIYGAALGFIFFKTKDKINNLHLFVSIWIFLEILRSKLFTGFPWSLSAYSFAFSDTIIQASSVIGPYGLGAIVVFSFASFFLILRKEFKRFFTNLGIILALFLTIYIYGNNRLITNDIGQYNIKMRLVQPSIQQTDKWSVEKFWLNFNYHKALSIDNVADFDPDLIIWPEAAVVVEPKYVEVLEALRSVIAGTNSILVTGGVTDNLNNPSRTRDKIYASIYALKASGPLIFDYHKSHLVPFGEYVPLSNILPIRKLTPGIVPYSPGRRGFIATIHELNLKLRPLLCYEIIFPDEVRMSNKDAHFILNLTNDAYYGESSGPYQHFYTARMRAVENGMPLIRVANNGITGIFDPLGRIILSTELNSHIYIDAFLPERLTTETIYSIYGNRLVYIYLLGSLFWFLFVSNKDQNK